MRLSSGVLVEDTDKGVRRALEGCCGTLLRGPFLFHLWTFSSYFWTIFTRFLTSLYLKIHHSKWILPEDMQSAPPKQVKVTVKLSESDPKVTPNDPKHVVLFLEGVAASSRMKRAVLHWTHSRLRLMYDV